MIVTYYDNAFDTTPKPVEISWPDFIATIRHIERPGVTDKRLLPGFSPAEIRPGASRADSNVLRVHFAVIDLDGITSEQLATIVNRLEGLAALFYTTWSHPKEEPGRWRLRLMVPFTRPVEAAEWRSLWPLLLARFSAPGDQACKDRSRMYFGPFIEPGTASAHIVSVFEGSPLDPGSLASLVGSASPPAPITKLESIPRERLQNLAKAWKRSRDETRNHLGLALERIVKGEPFAEEGNRDNTLFQLTRDLIRTWPNADPESIAAHFAQSLQVMGPDAPSLEQVRDKLDRASATIALERAQAEAEALADTKARTRQAFEATEPNRDWPYTDQEIKALTEKVRCTRDELTYRWIIQRGSVFYILGPQGYSKGYVEREAENAALRDLAPAESAGVNLWSISEAGEWYRKNLRQLMGEYGSVARDLVLDLRAQDARYDAGSCTFIEAPTPVRRELTPEFFPEVHNWLIRLAGPAIWDLLNWMALATDLHSTCAALVLTGPGDTGKNLFAHGMGRIWTQTQPTSLEQALSGFNEALARCPLVFADEQLPKDFRGNGRTAEIREFIGTLSRPLKRKYHADSVLLGAIRLIVASNNQDVLAFNESLSQDDIGALGSRFFHVQIPKRIDGTSQASDYLRRIPNIATFVSEDKIARHALWLRDNYPVKREGRFLIKTDNQQDTIRALSTKGGIRSSVCYWLVSYLRNPSRIDLNGSLLVRVKGGKLLANAQGILENWSVYLPSEAVPTAGRIANALSNISTGARPNIIHPKSGASIHYREIDPAFLYAWSETTEISSKEEINQGLAIDTETRMRPNPNPKVPVGFFGPVNQGQA